MPPASSQNHVVGYLTSHCHLHSSLISFFLPNKTKKSFLLILFIILPFSRLFELIIRYCYIFSSFLTVPELPDEDTSPSKLNLHSKPKTSTWKTLINKWAFKSYVSISIKIWSIFFLRSFVYIVILLLERNEGIYFIFKIILNYVLYMPSFYVSTHSSLSSDKRIKCLRFLYFKYSRILTGIALFGIWHHRASTPNVLMCKYF